MGKITTVYKGDMLFETTMGSHTLLVDVPESMGGSDRGPTPPEVFIASLGTCVGALVANYCNKTGNISTEAMTIDVTYDKAAEPTRLVNIKVKVNLPHALCETREAAIKRVAEHCPVHETMLTLDAIEFDVLDKAALEETAP
ncbi:MAG: OsmC family protein [Chloroflexi bacterium]|nr:OsmC family protein [Chloroflexota bacterium]